MIIEIGTFSLTKLHLKMSSAEIAVILSRPQCVNAICLVYFPYGVVPGLIYDSLTVSTNNDKKTNVSVILPR